MYVNITNVFKNVCTNVAAICVIEAHNFENVCRTIIPMLIVIAIVYRTCCFSTNSVCRASCVFLTKQAQIETEAINQLKHSAHLYERPSGFQT
jgi:hypothetical protein